MSTPDLPAIIALAALGILVIVIVVATLRIVARDGYHRVPTDPHRLR